MFNIRFPFLAADASGSGSEEEIETEEEIESEETEEETEEDEEEDKEEEPELTRVEFKDVKEKYPSFFKDFPTLKHAFFREQKLTEIFPTVEDAQKAAEDQSAFEEITSAIVDGNAGKFLSELENESKDGLKKFTSNFLPALKEADKNLYLETISDPLREFVKNVYNFGVREKDDNVKNAAKVVYKVIFGGGYEDVEKDTPIIERKTEVDKDREQYFANKYKELYKEVHGECVNQLDKEIDKGLEDLVKTKPGLKKMIAKQIKEEIYDAMDKDTNYMSRINGLWKKEQRNGFQGTYKTNFTTTFMSKARTLIPKLRAEARKEALGKEDNSKKEPTRFSAGKAGTNHSGKKMSPERAKTEKLTTKQIFDAD